jgi:hypothetical protein
VPFNGSGTFSRVYSWITDATNGLDISSSRMDADTNDIANGLSNCVTRDGQSPATANIPMGGFSITGLADGTAANPSLRWNSEADLGVYRLGTATIAIGKAASGYVSFLANTVQCVNLGGPVSQLNTTTLSLWDGAATTQVVGPRRTGYTNAMTGTVNRATSYDTSTITLVQLAQRVKALQDDLTTHGLIGV